VYPNSSCLLDVKCLFYFFFRRVDWKNKLNGGLYELILLLVRNTLAVREFNGRSANIDWITTKNEGIMNIVRSEKISKRAKIPRRPMNNRCIAKSMYAR